MMRGDEDGSANYNMVCEERDRLKDELGRATQEYLLSAQKYGVRIAQLKQLLRRTLRLPRPWIDGQITWEEWDQIMCDIEKELAQ